MALIPLINADKTIKISVINVNQRPISGESERLHPALARKRMSPDLYPAIRQLFI